MRDSTAALTEWLEKGGRRIGQIAISRADDGWELRHGDDIEAESLELFSKWEDARSLANLDGGRSYRPLKSAPNLRRGWRMVLQDTAAVRQAIDFFYPAMLGVWLASRAGELVPVHLRETLGRQTGMYRITAKLTDKQAQRLICETCNSAACLKTILWRVDVDQPIATLPPAKFDAPTGDSIPLLCHEACNLLVAAARKMVKGEA